MAQIDKLDEYTEIIETAQSGEDVRDAIIKAIIVVDEVTIQYLNRPMVSTYKQAVDILLNRFWEDVTTYYPDAVLPDHEDIDPPSAPMSDELENLLKALNSDTVGTDMREHIYGALSSIHTNIKNHDFESLYYYQNIIDLLNAFIDQCSNTEYQEAARATRDDWIPSDFLASRNRSYEMVSDDIYRVLNASTGNVMRPLLCSIFNNIHGILAGLHVSEFTVQELSNLLSAENAYDLERIARLLIPDVLSRDKWWVAVGDPYQTREEAENAAQALESTTTDSFFVRKFTVGVRTATTDGVTTATFLFAYYVLLDLGQIGFWTTILPSVYCESKGQKYPSLNIHMICEKELFTEYDA